MTKTKIVAVTGANGFVGQAVCKALTEKGHLVRPLVRSKEALAKLDPALRDDARIVGDIGPETVWERHLSRVDGLIHLAARVHVMQDAASDPLAEFRKVNVAGTMNLMRAAHHAGVSRMVFVSSVKVNGEATSMVAYSENSPVSPQDPYGVSKAEAEAAIREFSESSGMSHVILRPPLVYGPGVKANFAAMARLAGRGIPLPLGSIHNLRSLVHVDNLASACVLADDHPGAAYRTFMISDGEDFSVSDMIRLLAEGMGKKALLVPVPVGMLRLLGKIIGKTAQIDRLVGSLQVDSRAIRRELGWRPPVNAREGLRAVGKWFAAGK